MEEVVSDHYLTATNEQLVNSSFQWKIFLATAPEQGEGVPIMAWIMAFDWPDSKGYEISSKQGLKSTEPEEDEQQNMAAMIKHRSFLL